MMGNDDRGRAGLACHLGALSSQQRERRAELARWLRDAAVEIVELPERYELRLDPESPAARHVDEFVALESLCCPFLELRVRPACGGRGPVLEAGGGPELKAFVASELGILADGGASGVP